MKPATALKEGYKQNQAVSISFLKCVCGVGLGKLPKNALWCVTGSVGCFSI